jgi:hypothetical protein
MVVKTLPTGAVRMLAVDAYVWKLRGDSNEAVQRYQA